MLVYEETAGVRPRMLGSNFKPLKTLSPQQASWTQAANAFLRKVSLLLATARLNQRFTPAFGFHSVNSSYRFGAELGNFLPDRFPMNVWRIERLAGGTDEQTIILQLNNLKNGDVYSYFELMNRASRALSLSHDTAFKMDALPFNSNCPAWSKVKLSILDDLQISVDADRPGKYKIQAVAVYPDGTNFREELTFCNASSLRSHIEKLVIAGMLPCMRGFICSRSNPEINLFYLDPATGKPIYFEDGARLAHSMDNIDTQRSSGHVSNWDMLYYKGIAAQLSDFFSRACTAYRQLT